MIFDSSLWWDRQFADTLVWEPKNIYNFSCYKPIHLLHIRKNGQSKIQNFVFEIAIENKIHFLFIIYNKIKLFSLLTSVIL